MTGGNTTLTTIVDCVDSSVSGSVIVITISFDPTSSTTGISNVHPLHTTPVNVCPQTSISTIDHGFPVPTIVVPVLVKTAPLCVAPVCVLPVFVCPYAGHTPLALATPHTLSTIYPHTVVLLI